MDGLMEGWMDEWMDEWTKGVTSLWGLCRGMKTQHFTSPSNVSFVYHENTRKKNC